MKKVLRDTAFAMAGLFFVIGIIGVTQSDQENGMGLFLGLLFLIIGAALDSTTRRPTL